MTNPVEIDIPHKLGREAARARIAGSIDRLSDYIPGGAVSENRWEGDTLSFIVAALGQRAAAKIDVRDTHIHLAVDLPPMMGMFAGKVRDVLLREGPKLLK